MGGVWLVFLISVLGIVSLGGGTSVPGQGNGVKRRVLIGCG